MDKDLADLVAALHGFDVCLHSYVHMANLHYSATLATVPALTDTLGGTLKTLRYVPPKDHACATATFAHMFAYLRGRLLYMVPHEYVAHLAKVVRVYDATFCKNAANEVYATCMADKKTYILPRILNNCIDLAHTTGAKLSADTPTIRYRDGACVILRQRMQDHVDRMHAGGPYDTTAPFWQEAAGFARQVLARLDYSEKIKAVKNTIVGV